MPVREKTITTLMDGLIGSQWFMHGVVQGMPQKEYHGVSELAEAIYIRVVERIDWNRVVLEASSRHLALNHDEAEMDGVKLFSVEGICGECINEALLALDFGGKTITAWEDDPTSPRESEGSHPLPSGVGAQPRPSDEAIQAAVALAKSLDYVGRSYEDEV